MRRVVVTGMGIVSSIGNNTQEVTANLREAKSGIVQTADAYKDRARSAEAQQLEAAERQRAQLDAATQ